MKKFLTGIILTAALAAAAIWQLESRVADQTGRYEVRKLPLPELAQRKELTPVLALFRNPAAD